MSSDSVIFRGSTTIPKLTETNWNQWEQPMTTWLEFNGLYPYVTGEETEPIRPVKTETQSDESIAAATEKYNLRMTIWRQKNAQTRAALKTCIREDLQYVITPNMSAKQAWDEVVFAYKKQTVTGNTAIVTAIMNKTYKDGEDLSAHIGWMRQQNNFLLNTKLHIPDEILAARLLASLPPTPSWQPLAMTISTWEESKFTFSQVASTLQSEAQRRAATSGFAANPIILATSNLSQQKKPTCSYCNRSGGSHTAETCFVLHPELKEKLNKQKQKQQQASGKKTAQPANTQPDTTNVTIGNLDSSDDDDEQDYSEPCMDTTLSVQDTATTKYQSPRTGGHFTITMDGGSTSHVWKEHPTTMFNYREVTGRNLQVGDGRIIPVKGVGSIRFSTRIGNVATTITIHNVCHAPGMTNNLISEQLLDTAGYQINKGDGLCVVRPRHGKPILIAPKTSSKLYQTTAVALCTTQDVVPPRRRMSTPPRTATALSTVAIHDEVTNTNSAAHWHTALGHPSPSRLLKLSRHRLVTGGDWRKCQYYKEKNRQQDIIGREDNRLLDAGRGGANIDSLSKFSSSSNQQELPTLNFTNSESNDEADPTHTQVSQDEEKMQTNDDSDSASDEDGPAYNHGPAYNQPLDTLPLSFNHLSGALRRLTDASRYGPLENAPPPLNSVTPPMDANTHLSNTAVRHKATPDEVTLHQSILCTARYAANGTRPDITYAVNQCARYSSDPDHTHFAAAKKILRCIKGSVDQVLTNTDTNQKQPLLIGYSDADYANDKDDRLSVSGYTFLLCGGAVSWASRRQKTLVTSTVEAEYMAIAEAAKEAVWWRSLLGELDHDVSHPTPLFNDNQGSIHLAKNADHHARTKHIDVKYHYIRQELIKRTITLNHVSTRDNVADLFTKALVRDKHAAFTRTLGIYTPASSWGSVGAEASAAGMNAEQDARVNHVRLC
jgi:gag-polypeptide of LTR copia-type